MAVLSSGLRYIKLLPRTSSVICGDLLNRTASLMSQISGTLLVSILVILCVTKQTNGYLYHGEVQVIEGKL